jgi:hypothetical protein
MVPEKPRRFLPPSRQTEKDGTMRANATVLLAAAIFATSLGLSLQAAVGNDGPTSDSARISRGFKIAPVPLTYDRKDADLVGLGSYIVNAVGSCNDCHTWPNFAPGGDPYQGQTKMINAANYLAGGRPFGPFVSRNITPDATGRPAGLTWNEFKSVIRTGVDPDTGRLLQVMPWYVLQDMTERDIRAIYEYLKAIPHAEPAPPLPPA